MKGSAIANAERGIGNLFLIHKDARLEQELRRLAASPRVPPGSMNILILPYEDTALLLARCIILVTRTNERLSKITIQRLGEEDFTRGFIQSFPGGARIPPDNHIVPAGGPLWKPMWLGDIATTSDMLRNWSSRSEWL